MLFHFLGFALLEYCLFSLVCANPMKEQLKVAGDATVASGSGPSSSPPRKARPVRFSPYQKQQALIPGTFRCPNGQSIDEKKLTSLMADLCHMSEPELLSRNIKVKKLFFDERYDTFVYPINSDGSVMQQSASKEEIDSPAQYEILIDRFKEPPFKCFLAGVIFKVGEEILYCVHIPLLQKPLNPAIFHRETNSIFDCNGVQFKPYQVYLSMLAAKKALQERLIGPHPNNKEGFPNPFDSGIFTVEDLWMFPIIPGVNSVYINGDPGIYSVILTGTGMPVGVVYKRTDEEYAQEIAIKEKSPGKEKISKYRVCKIREYISID